MEDQIIIEDEERFFTKQDILGLDYFEEGKQFTSGKQIKTTILKILHSSREVCIPKGQIIYLEGQRADYGYFLVEGSVAFLSQMSDSEISQHKNKSVRLTQVQKKQLIANQLGIKPKEIRFNVNSICPGNFFDHRIFKIIQGKTTFGLSQMTKSGIRSFTAITTNHIKALMLPKKQFESSCSGYEQKRQDCIITPMCKQFIEGRGKQFLLSIFSSITKKHVGFNQVLYNEGDFPFAIYFIIQGEFQMSKRYSQESAKDTKNTRAVKTNYIPIKRKQAGQFIGIQEVLLKSPGRQFIVKSTQDSLVYKIEAKKFMFLLDDFIDVKKNLLKYIKQAQDLKKQYSNKIVSNVKNDFKQKQQDKEIDEDKIMEKIKNEMIQKNRGKNSKPVKRIHGYLSNAKLSLEQYRPQQAHRNKSFINLNPELNQYSFHSTPEKNKIYKNQSSELSRMMKTPISNHIKLDQKAHKRVMIRMGTYNVQKRNQIPKVGSQFKNNFSPIIDQIVRRHNTFLTKLDPKKRKSFVAEKYKATVQQQTRSKTSDPLSTMYKTWTVRSMKRSMKKYQDSIDSPGFVKFGNPQSHREKMSRFQGLICPSAIPSSRLSRNLQGQTSRRSSSGNRMVLVNHMMKPMVYYHNN